MEKLEPIRDVVVIRPDKSEAGKRLEEAGIELANNRALRSNTRGVVVAVGPGIYLSEGFVATVVKVGETVIYNNYQDAQDIGGEKLVVLPESQILAVVKPALTLVKPE